MTESHHGTKRQAPGRSPNPSNTNDDLSGEDDSSIPGTATYILQEGRYTRKAPARRRRKPFDSKRKAEVAEVRKIGACQICKSRKVRCTHALLKIKTESSNLPKSAFDSSSIIKTGDWMKPEESKLSPLNTDIHDPLDSDFGWVPTPTGRRDRIALDVHDIVNVINARDSLGYSGSQVTLNPQGWPQVQPSMVNPIGHSFLESSATLLGSNATYASHASPSAFTSVSAYGESELAFPQAVVHPCNVFGCEFAAPAHGFANELDLRRHQESRHPELYPPQVTYACRVPGCKAQRFMREQNLNTHIATTHPELLQQGNTFAQLQALNASGRFYDISQADSFLVGEGYHLPIDSNLDQFSGFSGALGEQMAPRNRPRRQTVSSRGANSPRGRPRGLDGVNRSFSLQKSLSRSGIRKQTASENGDLYLRAHEMGHSKIDPDKEAVSMGNMSNISFQMPVAAASRRNDGINGMELDTWMQPNPEQAAAFSLSGSSFSQSFEMGASLQPFQGPNMFQEEVSSLRENGGQSQSVMLRNDYSLQALMPSNVSWNQELDQSLFSLGSTFVNSYGNPQSHLINEDIRSYQGDFSIQPFDSPEQFTSQSQFRASRTEKYSGLKLNLDIPAAPSQYLSNEDCSPNFHSRSTSIQTPVITISQAVEDANPGLDLLPVQTEIKSAPLQPHIASMPQSYFSTSLSSSGANESLRTPTDMKNFFRYGSMNDASGSIGITKLFMNTEYDNVSNISDFADLNMLDDMQQ